jgi:hypothetical protein
MKPRLMQKCKIWMWALASCLAALPLLAQSKEEALAEMRLAFQQLNYAAAQTAGEKSLQDWQKLAPAELIEVYQVLGIIAFSEGDFFKAKTHFEAALSLAPDLKLDALYVSPKIQQFLQEVKDNLANNGHTPAVLRYAIVPDLRPQAALRSLLLPGLGQLQKQQRGKARMMMIAAGIGVVTTGVLHARRAAAQESYLSATTIAKAASAYDRYNLLNRARNGAALATAGVWLYSFFDALLAPPNQPALQIGISPSNASNEIIPMISWQMHF